MKNLAIVVLMLLSTSAWAGTETDPAGYTINVHVSSATQRRGAVRLKVIIDGKKCELEGGTALLIPGDYKARIVKEKHDNEYEVYYRIYELLFPDKRTRKYFLTGFME